MSIQLNDPSLLKQSCYINGEWITSDKKIDVTNPFDQTRIGSSPDIDDEDVQRSVTSAEQAGCEWRHMPAKIRSRLLNGWYHLIMDHQRDLARIMTAEQGKPFEESLGEISYAAAFVEWYAEEAKRIYGDTIPSPSTDNRILVVKSPVGVCAAITPWNFPSAMITRKVAPALAAGCTIIVKPSILTPFSALALAELSLRAGIPKGVLNVITGDSSRIGKILATHPAVRKLSFTGSTPTGKTLMNLCSGTVKKVSLELGGNAPFIVFEDADIDAAVKGAMLSKFRNTGQTCVCANRFLVHEKILKAFIHAFKEKVDTLNAGNGMEKGINQGPLIHMNAITKIESLLRDAVEKGARIVTGGRRLPLGKTFFEPTILENVTSKMKIFHDEIFGPVAPIISFTDEKTAIRIANDTPFGLAAYLYSRDIGRILRVSEELEYGMVGINTGLISTEVAPFGGVKESGIGREGSKYGIDEYLELKYLSIGGIHS